MSAAASARPRALVCDFGGVLTVPLLEAFARMQDSLGVEPRMFGAALARATELRGGRNPLHELEVGAIAESELVAALEAALAELLGRPVPLHGFGARYMDALDPNEELLAYLRTLRERGVRLALCTNNVREWEPLWRAKLPVDELFETVVDSAFVGVRKPDPAIFAIVLERLGLGSEQCMFLDDLPGNVEAARALGFAAIRFRDTAQAIGDIDALL